MYHRRKKRVGAVVVGRQPEVDKGNKQVEAVILVDQNVLFLLARHAQNSPNTHKKKGFKGEASSKANGVDQATMLPTLCGALSRCMLTCAVHYFVCSTWQASSPGLAYDTVILMRSASSLRCAVLPHARCVEFPRMP